MDKIVVDQKGYNQFYEELEKLKQLSLNVACASSESYNDAIGDGWHDNFDFEDSIRTSRYIASKIDKMKQGEQHLEIIDNINLGEEYINIDDCFEIEIMYDEADLEATLMCTITKENYNKVLEMCEFAIKHKVRSIRFFNYLKIGNALELSEDNILSDQELKLFFSQLDEARQCYPKELLNIKRNGTFGPNPENLSKFVCDACYDEVVIAPNMKVYPCIYMTKEGYEIGEYKDGQIYLYQFPTHNRKKCLAKERYNNNNNNKR